MTKQHNEKKLSEKVPKNWYSEKQEISMSQQRNTNAENEGSFWVHYLNCIPKVRSTNQTETILIQKRTCLPLEVIKTPTLHLKVIYPVFPVGNVFKGINN